MAKKRTSRKALDKGQIEESKEAEKVVTPPKKKIPTKDYTLLKRVKISGKWKEKGEKISLTQKGYDFFRDKKIV